MTSKTRKLDVDEVIAELDRRWAAINPGEPTVPNDQVVRWLETPAFRPWSRSRGSSSV